MKTPIAIAALFALGLCTGCSLHLGTDSDDGDDGYSVGTKGEGYPQVSAENITDTSQCRFGPPATQLFGRWQVDRQSGEFNSHTIYDFRGGTLSVTNHCEYIGHQMSSTVTVPIVDNGLSFRTPRGLSNTEYDFDMDCTASISATQVRYWFSGSCLSAQDQTTGEMLTMIPTW